MLPKLGCSTPKGMVMVSHEQKSHTKKAKASSQNILIIKVIFEPCDLYIDVYEKITL